MYRYDPPSHVPAFCVFVGSTTDDTSWVGQTTWYLTITLSVPLVKVSSDVGPIRFQKGAMLSSPFREVPRTGITPANAGKATNRESAIPPIRAAVDFIEILLKIIEDGSECRGGKRPLL